MGKSRLALLKTITIPRLELSAAALAVKLNRMIQDELDMVIDKTIFGQIQRPFCSSLTTPPEDFTHLWQIAYQSSMTAPRQINGSMWNQN